MVRGEGARGGTYGLLLPLRLSLVHHVRLRGEARVGETRARRELGAVGRARRRVALRLLVLHHRAPDKRARARPAAGTTIRVRAVVRDVLRGRLGVLHVGCVHMLEGRRRDVGERLWRGELLLGSKGGRRTRGERARVARELRVVVRHPARVRQGRGGLRRSGLGVVVRHGPTLRRGRAGDRERGTRWRGGAATGEERVHVDRALGDDGLGWDGTERLGVAVESSGGGGRGSRDGCLGSGLSGSCSAQGIVSAVLKLCKSMGKLTGLTLDHDGRGSRGSRGGRGGRLTARRGSGGRHVLAVHRRGRGLGLGGGRGRIVDRGLLEGGDGSDGELTELGGGGRGGGSWRRVAAHWTGHGARTGGGQQGP